MGPIKISIKTTQLEESSEYGGGSEATKSYSTVQESSNEDKENQSKDYDDKERLKVDRNESKSTESGPIDESCYKYEGDECYYTEPASGVVYRWDKENNQWVNKETGEAQPASCDSDQMKQQQQNYKMEGGTYVYVDKLTNQKHKWNLETNQWESVENNEVPEDDESEEDENATEDEKKARQYRKRKAAPGWDKSNYSKDSVTGVTTYTDPSDGVVYELDEAKNAWFPKLDDDFMAVYQLNYGFTADGKAEPTKPSEEVPKPTTEPIKKKVKGTVDEPAKWFDEDESKSTKVYVSNLPTSITEESFVELMSKCGMVEYDVRTKKPKLKIYRDSDNLPKGDGLCTYIKPESVQLALTILDGSEVDGKTISVQRAKFEMKGEYDPTLKPKKLTKKQLEKAKKQKEKLFAWVPEKMKGERAKHEKIIVIKNMFDVDELDADPGLILDYSSRIRAQSEKFGTVTKVSLFDKHPDGVCQVFFKEPSEADMAVQMLHGRLFGKKILSVETWDGKSKFKMEESKVEESERLKQWENFLQEENDKQEKVEKNKHINENECPSESVMDDTKNNEYGSEDSQLEENELVEKPAYMEET